MSLYIDFHLCTSDLIGDRYGQRQVYFWQFVPPVKCFWYAAVIYSCLT